ncbi:MAG: hypothetical protein R6X18_16265 [Chloroflexota bacterium]|jgi:hypothetical protein
MSNKVLRIRRIVIATLYILGLVLIGSAFAAEFTSLGPTPGFGVLQTFFFLAGVTALMMGGYLHLAERRTPDAPRSLQADIGIRLSATGLVLAYVGGFADSISIGTHIQPAFERPFLGPLQWGGIILGLIMILGGMVLYATARGQRSISSMDFLLNGRKQ